MIQWNLLNQISVNYFMQSITLSSDLNNLDRFNAFVLDCAKRYGLSPKKIEKLMLAIEEALVNIFNYAYPDSEGYVELSCIEEEKGNLVIEIKDTGIPFNPLLMDTPDLNSDIEKRKVGGLGIYLIKTLVDELDYRREGRTNILKIIMHKEDKYYDGDISK